MSDLIRGFLGSLVLVVALFALFGMHIDVWPPVIIIVIALAVLLTPDQ